MLGLAAPVGMPRTYFHVTPSVNRDSIEEHGLDWKLMGATNGVAGGRRKPEVAGIYLCDDKWDVDWFAEMAVSAGHPAVDVWEVSLDEETSLVEDESSGYLYLPQPIPRSEIRLIRADWTPESRFED
jgi:hypothetical protein